MIVLGIVDWIRRISNQDWYQVTEFIFFLSGIIGILRLVFKKSKEIPVRGYLLILVIFLIGLFLPTIRLILWDWAKTIDIILNILAMFCLLNFLGFLFNMKTMNAFSSSLKKKEKTIHIRSTHGFFDGSLQVHLDWEEFGGHPPNHRMNGKIWTPGKKEIFFKNKEIGFSISYGSIFLIRIKDAKINEATFEVTRR